MRPDVGTFVPELEDAFCDISEEQIFKYLTVGELPLFQGEVKVTLKRTNKFETEKPERKGTVMQGKKTQKDN